MTISRALRYPASFLSVLLAWVVAVHVGTFPKYVLPPPSDVLTAGIRAHDYLFFHARATMLEAIVGGALGITAGMCSGLLLTLVRPIRWLSEPYLVVFQAFPRESLAPLLLVWFGLGMVPKVAMSSLLCYFPVAIASLHAFDAVPTVFADLVRVQGGTNWDVFIYARLPHAVPGLLGAVRIGLPLAVIGAVIGELIGGSRGLGYVIAASSGQADMALLFAALVVLAGFSIFLVLLIVPLQAIVLKRYFLSLDVAP